MRRLIILIQLLLLVSAGFSQIPARPDPPHLYNNLSQNHADFLSRSEAARLEEKLEQFSNETSNQICVVIVDDLSGDEPAHYATTLLNEWGVGKADKNNGIVILLQLNADKGGHDFIAIGYGLEGAIPDLATKRIRDEELYPHLKRGENFEALDKTTDRLMQLAKGEISVKDYTRHSRKRGVSKSQIILIIIAVIIFLIIKGIFGGGGGGTTFSRRGRTYWGSGFGGFGGGGFGGGSSWGSGGGSGGWGGFGGGRSGGGGSGGSW